MQIHLWKNGACFYNSGWIIKLVNMIFYHYKSIKVVFQACIWICLFTKSWHNCKHINFKLPGIWILKHFKFGSSNKDEGSMSGWVLMFTKIFYKHNHTVSHIENYLPTSIYPTWVLPCLYVLGYLLWITSDRFIKPMRQRRPTCACMCVCACLIFTWWATCFKIRTA